MVAVGVASGGSGGSSSGSGSTGSSGGSSGWGGAQPTNAFEEEVEKKAARSYLTQMGFSYGQVQFITSDANWKSVYGQIQQYLSTNPLPTEKTNARLHTDLLAINTAYYAANAATGFLSTAITNMVKYKSAGFTSQEFADLYSNSTLFQQVDSYLVSHSFDTDAKNLVRLHKQTLLEDPDYKQANADANNPTLGTDAWARTLRFDFLDVDETPNAAEIALTLQFPLDAIRIRINMSNAIAMTERQRGRSGHNDMSDAFRHAYFQAINTQSVGRNTTQLFAAAHESETPPNLVIEREMDFFNNQVGIDFATTSPNDDNDAMANRINTAIFVGGLRFLEPLDANFNIIPGITRLVPTRP